MNILCISTDALRFDRVGCLNNTEPNKTLTPNIDFLGTNGARFVNNFTVSNGSAPSHASIFTGKYPQKHGVRQNGVTLSAKHSTIAEVLHQHGINTTGFVGSILLDSMYGLGKGFQTYSNITKWRRVHHLLSRVKLGKYNLSKVLVTLGIVEGRSRTYRETNKEVKDWINQNATEPFFMFIHYFDIHGDTFGKKKTIKEKHKNYNENVKLVDGAIGEIIALLKEKNVLSDTLIAVFADHGETLDEKAEKGHGKSVSHEEFHTPLIMYKEKLIPSKEITDLTRTIDIMPTILDFLQIDGPSCDGKSAYDSIMNGEKHTWNEVFLEAYPPYGDVKAIYNGTWKYVLEDGTYEKLYHLKNDPIEKNNVAQQNQETAQQLKRKLKQHFKIPFEEKELDDITKERLQGLGYLD